MGCLLWKFQNFKEILPRYNGTAVYITVSTHLQHSSSSFVTMPKFWACLPRPQHFWWWLEAFFSFFFYKTPRHLPLWGESTGHAENVSIRWHHHVERPNSYTWGVGKGGGGGGGGGGGWISSLIRRCSWEILHWTHTVKDLEQPVHDDVIKCKHFPRY